MTVAHKPGGSLYYSIAKLLSLAGLAALDLLCTYIYITCTCTCEVSVKYTWDRDVSSGSPPSVKHAGSHALYVYIEWIEL